jgi:serine/threonine protein phosphatase PrpC
MTKIISATDSTLKIATMEYKLSACTAQHIGGRAEQQDCLTFLKHPRHKGMALAVLADGMGGRTGGSIAAEQVITTTTQLFERLETNESPASMLAEAVTESHTVIKLLSISEEKEPHSTMVAMVLTPQFFHWVHVGDSRLYVFRHGVLKEMTSDHSFVTDAILSGRLTPEQAAVHPSRNMLTSALGSKATPRFSAGKLSSPQAGDVFLLASDGLWAHFKNSELCRVLTRMTAKKSAQLLLELARERGGEHGDNLSLVVIQLLSKDADQNSTIISY